MSVAALPRLQTSVWWVFLLQGAAGILLGLMLVGYPTATMVAIVTFLGFYWFFTGIMALVRMFVDSSVPWYWSLLAGLVGISAGLLVLNHPLFTALTVPTMIVVVLGVQGLVIGGLDIVGAFTGGGFASFFMGAINLILGALLLGSPVAAALVVPMTFGVLLLVQGAVLIVLAFRVRSA